MIDLLLKLVEKGIELVREGEKQRTRFFHGVVEPMHELFLKMAADHIATFQQIEAALEDPRHNIDEIRRQFERNAAFEATTILTLRQLLESKVLSQLACGPIEIKFSKYVQSIAICFIASTTDRPHDAPRELIAHYASVRSLLGMFLPEQAREYPQSVISWYEINRWTFL